MVNRLTDRSSEAVVVRVPVFWTNLDVNFKVTIKLLQFLIDFVALPSCMLNMTMYINDKHAAIFGLTSSS